MRILAKGVSVEFQAARCPSCGGELRVPTDRDVMKCLYCGSEVVVREAIAAARTPTIQTLLELAEAARDAGDYEDASTYYSRALELDPDAQIAAKAWVGKALSVCMLSTPDDIRYDEAMSYVDKAHSVLSSVDTGTVADVMVSCGISMAAISIGTATFTYLRDLGANLYAMGEQLYNSFNLGIPYERELATNAAFPYIANAVDRYEQALQYLPEATGLMKDIVSLLVKGPPVISKKVVEARIRKYVAKIRETEPGYRPPRGSKYNKGSCFIATAAFATDHAYEVRFLQAWRDEHLLSNVMGRQFVRLYYALGPYLATCLSRSAVARKVVRKTISTIVGLLRTVKTP